MEAIVSPVFPLMVQAFPCLVPVIASGVPLLRVSVPVRGSTAVRPGSDVAWLTDTVTLVTTPNIVVCPLQFPLMLGDKLSGSEGVDELSQPTNSKLVVNIMSAGNKLLFMTLLLNPG